MPNKNLELSEKPKMRDVVHPATSTSRCLNFPPPTVSTHFQSHNLNQTRQANLLHFRHQSLEIYSSTYTTTHWD